MAEATFKGQTIAVVGGGPIGLCAALALRHAVGERYPIALFDPLLAQEPVHEVGRAYALTEGSQRMLEVLGVWEKIADLAQAVSSMTITDSRLDDVVRQPLLTFENEYALAGQSKARLAWIIEGDILAKALRESCADVSVRLESTAVKALEKVSSQTFSSSTRLELADGRSLNVSFAVAADGKNSPLRRAAGLSWIGCSYGQSGIVATLAHERPHGGKAVQHFLPAGTFAMLPLTGNRSSLVWVEAEKEAPFFAALDEETLIREIERRFGASLGKLKLLDRPRSFPLAMGIARRFTAERLVLVGDAAHVVHPLAGLGLNIGLRDVAALAEVIADAARLGLDPAHASTFDLYERARHFDVLSTALAMDGMNRLFSNDILPLRLLRDLGLGMVDRWPFLKSLLAREAGGLTGSPPRLLKGEAL